MVNFRNKPLAVNINPEDFPCQAVRLLRVLRKVFLFSSGCSAWKQNLHMFISPEFMMHEWKKNSLGDKIALEWGAFFVLQNPIQPGIASIYK